MGRLHEVKMAERDLYLEGGDRLYVLNHSEMLARVLASGVRGMTWHMGSHYEPDGADKAFDQIVMSELGRAGICWWLQGPSDALGVNMNTQGYLYPEYGIGLDDRGKVIVDEHLISASLEAFEAGVDLSTVYLGGWGELLKQREKVRAHRPRLVKSQLTAPSCVMASGVLSEQAVVYQPLVDRAVAKGHIEQLRAIADVVWVSVDNPVLSSPEQLMHDFEVMFGDVFEEGVLVERGEEVMRAVHACNDYPILSIMRLDGVVDLLHWDAIKYPGMVMGSPEILGRYLEKAFLGIGVVPQSVGYLQDFAVKLGLDKEAVEAEAQERGQEYNRTIAWIRGCWDLGVEMVMDRWRGIVRDISRETGLDEKLITNHSFVSATCGFGGNRTPMARVAYDLQLEVAKQVSRN